MKNFLDKARLEDAGMVGGTRIFEVIEDFRYRSERGLITVPSGFLTDGASIPRIFWNILSPFGSYFPAALIHDFLYSKASDKHAFTRRIADRLFLIAMKEIGVGWLTRRIIYRAVRSAGFLAYKKK